MQPIGPANLAANTSAHMSSSPASSDPARKRFPGFAITAGVAAVVIMILVTTVDGLTRDGYSPNRHWISHLSLGDWGWLGVTNLVVCGVLFTVFGLGLWRFTRWGGGLVSLAGAALVVAGAVRIDPGLDYPAGQPAVHTASGSVHDLAAGVLFLSLIIAAIVVGRAARWTGRGIVVAVAIVVTFVACSVLVGLDYAGTWPSAPSGLLERIALFLALAWPVGIAFRLRPVPA
jgi:hypothetical membrane protein